MIVGDGMGVVVAATGWDDAPAVGWDDVLMSRWLYCVISACDVTLDFATEF